jgi:hypothetical protein
MSDTTTETVEQTDKAEEKSEAKGLRAKLEESLAETKKLRADALVSAYEKLGLSTNDGLGKAIAKEYDGEANYDALAAYAKNEYGHDPVVAENPPHPQSQAIAQGHQALEQVAQTAGSVPVTPTAGDALAKAEAEGDYATTMAIKGQQMADMMRNRR